MQSVKQFETDEKLADPIRLFREDGWMVGGTIDGVEAVVDASRQDANKRRRWARYFGFRPGDVQPVEVTIRQVNGEFQALVVHDPKNPRMTDEAVMSRFDYDQDEAWEVAS